MMMMPMMRNVEHHFLSLVWSDDLFPPKGPSLPPHWQHPRSSSSLSLYLLIHFSMKSGFLKQKIWFQIKGELKLKWGRLNKGNSHQNGGKPPDPDLQLPGKMFPPDKTNAMLVMITYFLIKSSNFANSRCLYTESGRNKKANVGTISKLRLELVDDNHCYVITIIILTSNI